MKRITQGGTATGWLLNLILLRYATTPSTFLALIFFSTQVANRFIMCSAWVVMWYLQDGMTRKDDPDDYVVVDPLLEKGKQKFNKMQAKLKRREREWAGRSLTWPHKLLEVLYCFLHKRPSWIFQLTLIYPFFASEVHRAKDYLIS